MKDPELECLKKKLMDIHGEILEVIGGKGFTITTDTGSMEDGVFVKTVCGLKKNHPEMEEEFKMRVRK